MASSGSVCVNKCGLVNLWNFDTLSVNNSLASSNPSERLNCYLHLLCCVSSGELNADTRLAVRHYWEAEADHVDPLLHHLICHLCSQTRVFQQNRDNWALVVS